MLSPFSAEGAVAGLAAFAGTAVGSFASETVRAASAAERCWSFQNTPAAPAATPSSTPSTNSSDERELFFRFRITCGSGVALVDGELPGGFDELSRETSASERENALAVATLTLTLTLEWSGSV